MLGQQGAFVGKQHLERVFLATQHRGQRAGATMGQAKVRAESGKASQHVFVLGLRIACFGRLDDLPAAIHPSQPAILAGHRQQAAEEPAIRLDDAQPFSQHCFLDLLPRLR